MSRISVRSGNATVEIEAEDWRNLVGTGRTAWNPHDLIAATIKALRAIDTDISKALANGLEQMPVSGVPS